MGPAGPAYRADVPSSTREAWLEASVDLTAQLLHVEDGVGPVVGSVVHHVRRLVRARTVTFVAPKLGFAAPGAVS